MELHEFNPGKVRKKVAEMNSTIDRMEKHIGEMKRALTTYKSSMDDNIAEKATEITEDNQKVLISMHQLFNEKLAILENVAQKIEQTEKKGIRG